MTQGLESAFPFEENDQMGNHYDNHFGMSTRLYLAGMAMQGLLSAQSVYKDGVDAEWTAKTAVNCADWLLKQEEETR